MSLECPAALDGAQLDHDGRNLGAMSAGTSAPRRPSIGPSIGDPRRFFGAASAQGSEGRGSGPGPGSLSPEPARRPCRRTAAPWRRPPRPDGRQLDTAARAHRGAPGGAARHSTAPPPRAPAEAPAKPPARHRPRHRQITGVFRQVTGSAPCTLRRHPRPRLFTANKAPSDPPAPPQRSHPRSAGPAAGHFSGDSPGFYRETAGPALDP